MRKPIFQQDLLVLVLASLLSSLTSLVLTPWLDLRSPHGVLPLEERLALHDLE